MVHDPSLVYVKFLWSLQSRKYGFLNYPWLILILSFLHIWYFECMSQVILCGLIGIPPSNGVIPQSPMHTKSLATLKHQVYIYTYID
jgi:hypothetical protein